MGRRRTHSQLNGRQSYMRLPRRINPRDTVSSHPVCPARVPEGGRGTDRDVIIRCGDPFD